MIFITYYYKNNILPEYHCIVNIINKILSLYIYINITNNKNIKLLKWNRKIENWNIMGTGFRFTGIY